MDFQEGIPTFKNENEAWVVNGYSPREKAKCIMPFSLDTVIDIIQI